jgi:hypothetical protein
MTSKGAAIATVVLLGVGILSPRALAGPPFVTDDPEPVEKGHGEFYVASEDAWTGNGGTGTLPHFELNYGPFRELQLHVIAPLAWTRAAGTGTTRYGFGDTELGVKWRFVREGAWCKRCPQVGTFPLVELPTGDQSRGLGSGHSQLFLPIWLQKSWGREGRRWTTYGGGGYRIRHGAQSTDSWFTGWEVQRQFTDALTLGAELFHETPSAVGAPSQLGFNLGGSYDLFARWHGLFSGGRDLRGPARLTVYLALQRTF